MTEDGRRRTEDGGRKAEDGSRKAEDGRRRTEDGGRKTEDGRRRTDKASSPCLGARVALQQSPILRAGNLNITIFKEQWDATVSDDFRTRLIQKVLPMSSNTCYPSLRTKHPSREGRGAGLTGGRDIAAVEGGGAGVNGGSRRRRSGWRKASPPVHRGLRCCSSYRRNQVQGAGKQPFSDLFACKNTFLSHP